jgi:hypothetical protein
MILYLEMENLKMRAFWSKKHLELPCFFFFFGALGRV